MQHYYFYFYLHIKKYITFNFAYINDEYILNTIHREAN